MMGKTHMAFGFLAGMLTFPIFNANWLIFIPLTMLGTLFPDVDHENSKINRMLPVTRWVPTFFRHRGFFHSIFPAAIIYGIFYYANMTNIGLPLTIGYLAHLASDCLTRTGCNLLHPITSFRISGFIMTDGIMELVTFAIVIFLDALIVAKHFL